MMMRFVSVALAFFVTPWILAAADDEAVQKELKALEGSWKVVSGFADGQEIPKGKLPKTTYVVRADRTIAAQSDTSRFSMTATRTTRRGTPPEAAYARTDRSPRLSLAPFSAPGFRSRSSVIPRGATNRRT